MSRGTVQIGSHVFPPPGTEGVAIVSYKSSAKFDEKESGGKDDATTEFKGRKPCAVQIVIKWNEDDDDAEEAAVAMLEDISPRGPNAGEPQEFVGDGQETHSVYKIEVKELDDPSPQPGSSERIVTLGCASWTKPTKKTNVSKTPKTATPWGTNTLAKQSGSGASGFSSPVTAPKVNP